MSVTLVVFKQRPGDFHLSFDRCFFENYLSFVIFVRFGRMTDVKVEACPGYLILVAGSPTWLPRNLKLSLKFVWKFQCWLLGSFAWATQFYSLVARPDYQTKILKSYTGQSIFLNKIVTYARWVIAVILCRKEWTILNWPTTSCKDWRVLPYVLQARLNVKLTRPPPHIFSPNFATNLLGRKIVQLSQHNKI